MYTSDINEDDVDVEGDEDETAGDDIDDVEKVNTGRKTTTKRCTCESFMHHACHKLETLVIILLASASLDLIRCGQTRPLFFRETLYIAKHCAIVNQEYPAVY